ncbi:MAG TPA: IPT/TIG domain-containing protein [Nitrospira sp.]
MVMRMGSTTMALIGVVALVLVASDPGQALGADKEKPAKKPKAAPEAKAPKSKADQPKFKTAETAAKSKACFGEVPKIEKVTPDEGKAGDKVTITGKKFGTVDCLRGVSFGPGHAATFTMKNETTITATVPAGGRKGLAMLTVTTASGEDSKTFLVK